MIKCPKCRGIGKTISTRNQDDSIIRWHKCENCGFTFTSTQTVDCRFSNNVDEPFVDALINSAEFKLATTPLTRAFNANVDSWKCTKNNIKSNLFENKYSDNSYMFNIDYVLGSQNLYGLIYLQDSNANKTIIGQVKYADNLWDLTMDISTINKINNDFKKGE